MKNAIAKTGLKTGATMACLAFLSLGIVPACSSPVSILVGILLAGIMGALWFPFMRDRNRTDTGREQYDNE